MAHAYVTFRRRLAIHAFRRFGASLKSSAEIMLLVFAQVVIGLFALVALPPMYAASQAPLQAIGLLAAHGLAMALPALLLRKRVLPLDVVYWLRRLPVPPSTQFAADALVAAMMVGPLALLYAVSATVWVYQGPDWLLPVRGVLGTLFSLLLTYACTVAVLSLRARRAPASARWQRRLAPPPVRYAARQWRSRVFMLWHRLFWLPFWRNENMVGRQQSLLLAAGVGAALPWMQAPPGVARAVLALVTSALMVLLTDRGDKAVREQIAALRPLMAAWPLQARSVQLAARAFALLPALLVLAIVFGGGLVHGVWARPAGRAYLVLGCVAQVLLVAIPRFTPRARVGLVVVQILVLTAVGSELWQ
ncbi:hypothetical protein INH39_09865 [Massilia violaceinigra]|uniref:ABC transporter permease n=1 Tax=Massilia violaceinigra TaxID=2045208 RepID=A0ABY4AAV4_9BURK|nr:hypothetical protein [Massilia violaceinigra]UOD31939.1 hypothetical protein INH39_09865 [Massilia violaceinigra]